MSSALRAFVVAIILDQIAIRVGHGAEAGQFASFCLADSGPVNTRANACP